MVNQPFPYFGGKSRVASEVWRRFGDVKNYVEPFCGSAGVLLNRPRHHVGYVETINDAWAFVSNFWRAVKLAPKEVARFCDWPVNAIDLQARHRWLLAQAAVLERNLTTDSTWYDPKAAGWWAWGQSLWIGEGWCVPRKTGKPGEVRLARPSLEDRGLARTGRGGELVRTCKTKAVNVQREIAALSDRLRRVRVLHGDWEQAVTQAVTTRFGLTGVFLDSPYTEESGRDMRIYAADSGTVGHDVHAWAVANGNNPLLRIAVCGYEGEYEWPDGWRKAAWKNLGGKKENRERERIWFSPHCLP